MLACPMNPLPFNHVQPPATLPVQPGTFSPSTLSMPPTKRPKLSLQTSLSTAYGSSASATGKRIDNLSAVTPTTLNTFNNTFDLSIRPSPSSATTSPASQFPRKAVASPLRRQQPYSLNLPFGVRSILKNSRLSNDYRSLTASASPRTGRRVFFPPTKKVSFHSIDEEIVTHTYTARNIDLSSSEDEHLSSERDKDESTKQDDDATPTKPTGTIVEVSVTETSRARSPQQESRGRRRRERSTSEQRTTKKRRRWEWTLENAEDGSDVDEGRSASPAVDVSETVIDQDSSKTNYMNSDDVEDSQEPPSGSPQHETGEEALASIIVDELVDDNQTVNLLVDECDASVTAIAETIPLPPSPTHDTPSHVLAMVKRFEDIDG